MSSSVGMQMPVLYLRGSIKNTMRDMDEKTRSEVEEIIKLVSNDPNLQACKTQFKMALKYTIGSDYKSDPDTAEQEFLVAVWKAAVAAKCGWGKHPASHQTIVDEVQRKKFFQTWVFNFLRQILLENKPSIRKSEIYENISTYENSKNEILQLINGHSTVKEYSFGECEIVTDTNLFNSSTISKINSLIDYYNNKNIDIIISQDKITINSKFELLKKDIIKLLNPKINHNSEIKFQIYKNLNLESSETITKLNELLEKYFNKLDIKITHESIEINNSAHAYTSRKTIKSTRIITKSVYRDENDESEIPEIASMNPEEFKDQDTVKIFYKNLSEDAKKIVEVIMNPPQEYEDKYKTTKPVQKYISEFLGFDLNYTKQLYSEMRIVYVDLVGTPKD